MQGSEPLQIYRRGNPLKNISRRSMIQGAAAGTAIAAVGRPTFAQEDMDPIVVASSDYTEQFILAEMMALMLEDAGYAVEREHNLGGTFVVHEGREAGDIDVHVDYTGQSLTILDKTVEDIADEGDTRDEQVEKVYEYVKETYEEEFNTIWLDPLGLNNTYALAMRREDAEERGIETYSDLIPVANELTLGASQEFLVRDDGLLGIQDLYGMTFSNTSGMASGLMYSALQEGEMDVISAFATDGRIQSMDFVLLEDDLGFFPPYYACPLVRAEIIEQAPETREILNQLAGKIDDSTMQGLNFRVDDGGEEFSDVARDFLTEQGIIGGDN